ncbi:uncharacterized protein METZ01_LOCUS508379, partial [marine metagenome]
VFFRGQPGRARGSRYYAANGRGKGRAAM